MQFTSNIFLISLTIGHRWLITLNGCNDGNNRICKYLYSALIKQINIDYRVFIILSYNIKESLGKVMLILKVWFFFTLHNIKSRVKKKKISIIIDHDIARIKFRR